MDSCDGVMSITAPLTFAVLKSDETADVIAYHPVATGRTLCNVVGALIQNITRVAADGHRAGEQRAGAVHCGVLKR